jgi:hypothetical protein
VFWTPQGCRHNARFTTKIHYLNNIPPRSFDRLNIKARGETRIESTTDMDGTPAIMTVDCRTNWNFT